MTEYLFVGGDEQVLRQFDIAEKKLVKTWSEIDSDTTYIISIPDSGKYIFMGSTSHELFQYSMTDGSLIKAWGVIAENFINCIKVSSDDKYLFTASMDENLCQFSLDEKQLITKLPNENTFLMELIVINSVEYLFCVSDGKYLKQFYINPKLALYKDWGAVEGEDASIESMTYSEPHKSLFTTFGGTISQWGLEEENLIRKINTNNDSILSMIVCSKGESQFASSEDGKLIQYKIENGEIEQDWTEVKGGPFGMEESMICSGDGEWLFTAEEGCGVKQWSLTNKGQCAELEEGMYMAWMPLVVIKY